MDLLKILLKQVETALRSKCWDVVFNNDNNRNHDCEAIKRSSKNKKGPEEPVEEKCDGNVKNVHHGDQI